MANCDIKFTDHLKSCLNFAVPAQYDDSISLYELEAKVVAKLNETITNLNMTVKDLCNFKQEVDDRFDDLDGKLKPVVLEILEQWKSDGTLADIINEALFEGKLDKDFISLHVCASPLVRTYCFVVTLEDGQHWLFDTSSQQSAQVVAAEIKNLGINKIDGIVISHYHWDHAGGLPTIATVIDITGAQIYLPPTPDWTKQPQLVDQIKSYYDAIQTCISTYNLKATIPTAQTSVNLTEQGDTLKFYNTDQTAYYNLPSDQFIYNNCSLVATVSKGEKVMMFTGDIYSGGQQTIASAVPKVCIMLDPHHGDMGEFSHEFFEKTHPEVGITVNGDGTYKNDLIGFNSSVQAWYADMGIPNYIQGSATKSLDFYMSAYSWNTIEATYQTGAHTYLYNGMGPAFIYTDIGSANITMKQLIKRMPQNSCMRFRIVASSTAYDKIVEAWNGFFPSGNNLIVTIDDITATTTPNPQGLSLGYRRGYIMVRNDHNYKLGNNYNILNGEYVYNDKTNEFNISWFPFNANFFFRGYGSYSSLINNTTCGYSARYIYGNGFSYNNATGEITLGNSGIYEIQAIITSTETAAGSGVPRALNMIYNVNGTYASRFGVVKDTGSPMVRTEGMMFTTVSLDGGDKITFTLSETATGGYTYEVKLKYIGTYTNFNSLYTDNT